MADYTDTYNALQVESTDSLFRPYMSGVTQQELTIATILLMSDNQAQNQQNIKPTVKNYLNSFNSYIDQLIPTPTSQQIAAAGGVDTNPSGKIWVDSLDGVNPYYGIFNNFSLLSVIEGSDQIIKIHQNFGATWNAFFFGNKPQIYTFSGFFLDTKEYPYYQEFLMAYDKILAGRLCIQNNIIMKIVYDNKMISGYMMNISTGMDASTPLTKQFRFSILVNAPVQWIRTNYHAKQANGNGSFFYYEDSNSLDNTARVAKLLPPQQKKPVV
jgi:hypothetical protein